jgi:hypothetical protein
MIVSRIITAGSQATQLVGCLTEFHKIPLVKCTQVLTLSFRPHQADKYREQPFTSWLKRDLQQEALHRKEGGNHHRLARSGVFSTHQIHNFTTLNLGLYCFTQKMSVTNPDSIKYNATAFNNTISKLSSMPYQRQDQLHSTVSLLQHTAINTTSASSHNRT